MPTGVGQILGRPQTTLLIRRLGLHRAEYSARVCRRFPELQYQSHLGNRGWHRKGPRCSKQHRPSVQGTVAVFWAEIAIGTRTFHRPILISLRSGDSSEVPLRMWRRALGSMQTTSWDSYHSTWFGMLVGQSKKQLCHTERGVSRALCDRASVPPRLACFVKTISFS